MRFLIQRTRSAAVHIDGIAVAESHGLGMLILIGISPDDTVEDIEYLVKKATQLRIFDDEDGVMNCSILDVGGDLAAGRDLVVEGGQDQGALVGLEAHTGQDGYRGTDRHGAGGPGDGLGKDVAVNPELHCALLSALRQSRPREWQDDP